MADHDSDLSIEAAVVVTVDGAPRIEYVEARRVLLDALDALRYHLGAVVLVGAQAVYLRTEGRIEGYQPSPPMPTWSSTPPCSAPFHRSAQRWNRLGSP